MSTTPLSSYDLVLAGVVLLDEIAEVGDRLGLAQVESHFGGSGRSAGARGQNRTRQSEDRGRGCGATENG